jgi:hypothetical protein
VFCRVRWHVDGWTGGAFTLLMSDPGATVDNRSISTSPGRGSDRPMAR